ncbi:hypothetical protein KIN20_000911 [Parelaphostrongylus tenuis]|uniref:Uncharacterized protein n=1 Tax=Parelaphostrongylus tenuis TaxID=148309 RepID=A0AAD5LT98_PARTN|nr:hypothetical protein KIN20_000911 [Parelaphostrongylus tenuis]
MMFHSSRETFRKIVDFIVSDTCASFLATLKQTIMASRFKLFATLNNLPCGDVQYFGGSLWLSFAKLILNTVVITEISYIEWDDILSPIEKWLMNCDSKDIVTCFRLWSNFVNLIKPKTASVILEKKWFARLMMPMRSRAILNKVSSPSPIIQAYISLLCTFSDSIDDLFEQLVICFLRFLLGRSVSVISNLRIIEDEVMKPISSTTFTLVLQGNFTEFSEYVLNIFYTLIN